MAFFSSEDNQTKREDDALAKWVADPANTAWMESKYQWALKYNCRRWSVLSCDQQYVSIYGHKQIL